MLCLSPTIWHFQPPSSFSLSSLDLLVPSLCPFTSLLPLFCPPLLPPELTLWSLSLSLCISLSSQQCVTGRPAELTGLIEHTRTGIETEQVRMIYFKNLILSIVDFTLYSQ